MYPSQLENTKWQRMQAVVNQQALALQPTPSQPFQKLVIIRLIHKNLLVFLIQYIGLMSSTLASPSALLWFASGTSCAFVFMRGYKILPGIWLGSFFAYYFSNSGLGLAVGCATIHVLQAYLLFLIGHRYISLTLNFNHRFTLSKFIFYSLLLTGFFSMLLLLLCYPVIQTRQTLLSLWIQWWLANFNGLSILAVALVTLDLYFPQINELKQVNRFFCLLLYGLLLLNIVILMFSRGIFSTMVLVNMIMFLVVLISLTYRWCGTVAALFLIGFLYGIAESLNAPVFNTIFASETFTFLQSTMSLEIIIGLFIAVNEKSR